ncbi:galactosyltransferase-related protein [Qipengyuania sp.]|uniref:galactosyltransferase-related protein n=1 Tax=Qipengyuania sp. TaxID=2004515 RepID=UPI0035C796AA
MSVSVCTLAYGRAEHLANLVRGLALSNLCPDELVVAVMQNEFYALPEAPFPVRQIDVSGQSIPLARARNTAARAASGDLLIFLDVDCIPHPDLVGDYQRAAETDRGVFMGEVGYLPEGATAGGIDYERFETLAVKHSERAGPPTAPTGYCEDYRCFWSLNFALAAETFAKSGGFDESYVGYGGEDTDFGRCLTSAGINLWWVRGARAYHQYHPHHMPPVHHLDSVLTNAACFKAKWGEETMQHWLRAFTLMGLIKRDGAGGWVKLREPNDADLAMTRQQEHQPFASSAWVLDQLEARELDAGRRQAAIASA